MQREAKRRRNGRAVVTVIALIVIVVAIFGYLSARNADNATNAQQTAITRRVNGSIATARAAPTPTRPP